MPLGHISKYYMWPCPYERSRIIFCVISSEMVQNSSLELTQKKNRFRSSRIVILISKYPVILPLTHPAFCFLHLSSAILPCVLEHSARIGTNVKSDAWPVNTVFSADFGPLVVNALCGAASFIENIMQAHRNCCWLCNYQSLLISCYMGHNKTIIINYDRTVYVCTGRKPPLLFFSQFIAEAQ